MSNKFVLESFQAYLEFSNSKINEAKDEFTPDLNFVKKYVEKILENQKELGLKNSNFSKYEKEPNPYESWIKNYQSKKGKDWPGKESSVSQHVYGSFAAPYLWPKLTEEQKDQIYKEMLELMKKSGYTKEKDFERLIKDKKVLSQKPFISIIPSTVEIKETEIPGKIKIIGIDGGTEDKVFKDNRWGSGSDSAGGKVNSEAFQNPVVLEEIKKEIDLFMKKFSSGSITKLNSVIIESSASRYRNTEKAENLSWGELSYNRAITIVDLFREAADANNLSEEKRKEFQEKTQIQSNGANGDGTSGPNPPGPTIGFGYYDENSKWVQNNGTFGKGKSPEQNRNTVVISVLGEKGKPTGKYTTLDYPPVGPQDYSNFRFVNFTIDAEGTLEDPPVPIVPRKEDKYTPRVAFPKISSGGTSTKKRRTRTIGKRGQGTSPRSCPTF